MDEVFRNGRCKGKHFSDVAANDPAFVAWAKRQQRPTGQIDSFVKFLKQGGHRGQTTLSSFVTVTRSAPAPASNKMPDAATTSTTTSAIPGGSTSSTASPNNDDDGGPDASTSERMPSQSSGSSSRFGATLSLEIVSPDTFEVGPSDAQSQVPHTIRVALSGHPDVQESGMASRWHFPARVYAEVLEWLSFNRSFRCSVDPIPDWVLQRLPAFVPAAEQVKATKALKLSSETQRLLAALRPRWKSDSDSRPPLGSPLDEPVVEKAEVAKVPVPKSPDIKLNNINGTLLPFQAEAVKEGLKREGRILIGDEMGLGKTVTALVLAQQYISDWPILVVAPAPLCHVWKEHAAKWLARDLSEGKDIALVTSSRTKIPSSAKMVIISYNLISNESFQTRPDGKPFQALVLDECHFLRGATTLRAKTIAPLAKKAKRCLLLSGTPLVSRGQDAYSFLEAILPEGSLPAVNEFAARYSEMRVGPASSLRSGKSCEKVKVDRSAVVRRSKELHTLIASVMIRRKKEDLLPQLPRKWRMRVTLPVPVQDDAKIPIGATDPGQISNGHDDDKDEAASKKRFEQPLALACDKKVGAVGDYLRCLLQSGVKFLIFAHHLRMLDALEKVVRDEEVEYIRIDGSTALPERAASVARFQENEDVKVALLSLTACSQGLTLTAASLVVFAELYWVPGVLLQAEDRAHRIGQQESVLVQYLTAPGTEDERIFQVVERRAKDTATATDGQLGRRDSADADGGDGHGDPHYFKVQESVSSHAAVSSLSSSAASAAVKRSNPVVSSTTVAPSSSSAAGAAAQIQGSSSSSNKRQRLEGAGEGVQRKAVHSFRSHMASSGELPPNLGSGATNSKRSAQLSAAEAVNEDSDSDGCRL